MKKKIGIIGYGYVGRAMAKLFENNYDVIIYEVMNETCTEEQLAVKPASDRHVMLAGGPVGRRWKFSDALAAMRGQINDCDLAVICVPTPRNEDGSCDISAVETVMGWLTCPHILLKSTVDVGTTDFLNEKHNTNIVFSPEYCGESTYWTPYAFHTEIKETPFFIFGGPTAECSHMIDFFMPVCGPTKQYRMTDARTAEMVKYMENTFFYTKVMFCYEIAQICSTLEVDYNQARELWLLDPRINPMHTAVFKKAPGEKAISGKCLPKDLAALINRSERAGYNPTLLKEVQNANDRISAMWNE